ncbi:hypothetical protein [Shouchella clausii]|uniref:hypothetical protein n=1 Tax=Shouchella clausii TaxID=79880 RepID=UPI001C7396CF|nr:hypothetical protein [Shouchella clausii]MBX0320133.1 hypothetical protein [Shouchella clausii]
MNNHEQWLNFDMGTELRVSGSFIFDGIRTLDEMRSLNETENIFTFLYYITVGIERLQKVCIVLIENKENTDQTQFVNKLKSHNPDDLMTRIRKSRTINLKKEQRLFLNLLARFYINDRYGRYDKKKRDNEKRDDLEFENEIYGMLGTNILHFHVINFDSDFLGFIDRYFKTRDIAEIREKFSDLLRGIVTQLYSLIEEEASKNNIHTYEISPSSSYKAFKIFVAKEFDFDRDRRALKETLTYILTSDDGRIKEFKNTIENNVEPLDLSGVDLKTLFSSSFADESSMVLVDAMTTEFLEIEDESELKTREDFFEAFYSIADLCNSQDDD